MSAGQFKRLEQSLSDNIKGCYKIINDSCRKRRFVIAFQMLFIEGCGMILDKYIKFRKLNMVPLVNKPNGMILSDSNLS